MGFRGDTLLENPINSGVRGPLVLLSKTGSADLCSIGLTRLQRAEKATPWPYCGIGCVRRRGRTPVRLKGSLVLLRGKSQTAVSFHNLVRVQLVLRLLVLNTTTRAGAEPACSTDGWRQEQRVNLTHAPVGGGVPIKRATDGRFPPSDLVLLWCEPSGEDQHPADCGTSGRRPLCTLQRRSVPRRPVTGASGPHARSTQHAMLPRRLP